MPRNDNTDFPSLADLLDSPKPSTLSGMLMKTRLWFRLKFYSVVGMMLISGMTARMIAQEPTWLVTDFPGAVADIAGTEDNLWAISTADEVYRRAPGSHEWIRMYTPLYPAIDSASGRQQIFVTLDSTVWIRTGRDAIGSIGKVQTPFFDCRRCALTVDRKGSPWVVDGGGFRTRDDSGWARFRFPETWKMSANDFNTIAADSNGTIWAIGVSSNGTRHLISIARKRIMAHPIRLANAADIGVDAATGMAEEITDVEAGVDGSIWLATGGGLVRFVDGKFMGITNLPWENAPGSPWSGPAAKLAVDRSGVVTFIIGLEVYFLANGKLYGFWRGNSALPYMNISAVTVTHTGETFVGAGVGNTGRFATLVTREWLPLNPEMKAGEQ
jgi:hypothetical protein